MPTNPLPSEFAALKLRKSLILNDAVPNLYLPRPQRIYPWLKSYLRRLSIEVGDIGEVISLYGLDLIKRPKPASGGVRNNNFILNTSRGKKFLKMYKESLGQSTIVQEHSILKYLAKIRFPAARLEVTRAGETLVQRDKDRYALFDFVGNGFCSYDYITTPNQARQYIAVAGKMLAFLHDKLKDFVPEGYNPDGFKAKTGKRWRDNEWFVSKLKICMDKAILRGEKKNNHKSLWLLQRARDLENELKQTNALIDDANLPRQIIHKDYGPSNLLFRKNELPIVIDFEIARLDWRVVDIIDGWQGFCVDRTGYNVEKMKCFLDAYQFHMPLTADEFKMIPEVWKLLQIRSCIRYWYAYCMTGNRVSLVKACKCINECDWLTTNQTVLW